MERFAADLLSPAAERCDRLRLLQWALFGLVQRLDEEGTYGASDWLTRADTETRASPVASMSPPEAELRKHLATLAAQP